jgi:hypothetical protein
MPADLFDVLSKNELDKLYKLNIPQENTLSELTWKQLSDIFFILEGAKLSEANDNSAAKAIEILTDSAISIRKTIF